MRKNVFGWRALCMATVVATVTTVIRPSAVANGTNDVAFTAIQIGTNGVLTVSLTGPPLLVLLMECSDDLVSWNPLKWYKDEQGDIAVELDQIDADGQLLVEDTEGHSRTQRFYRATWLSP